MGQLEDISSMTRLLRKSNSQVYGGRHYTDIIKKFVSKCDHYQRLVRPLPRTHMPLISVNPSLTFKIWVINFIGPFPVLDRRSRACYIRTTVKYVTKCVEAEPVETFSSEVAAKFIYEILLLDLGVH